MLDRLVKQNKERSLFDVGAAIRSVDIRALWRIPHIHIFPVVRLYANGGRTSPSRPIEGPASVKAITVILSLEMTNINQNERLPLINADHTPL
jgi:hypothetical protein